MARVTDTRQRVRDIAAQLSSQGIEPTPGLVRDLLGKGSPNTIVGELRAWKAERSASPSISLTTSISSPTVLEKAGLHEVAESLRAATESAHAQSVRLQELSELQDVLSQVLRQQDSLSTQLSLAVSSLISEREKYFAQLSRLEERFDGMQKFMLKSIDDARDEARTWKDRAKLAHEELIAWRTTVQQRIESLREENGRLQGRLEQSEASR